MHSQSRTIPVEFPESSRRILIICKTPQFDKQFKHPKQGEKHYSTILGYVVAQVFAELKAAKQAEEAAVTKSEE